MITRRIFVYMFFVLHVVFMSNTRLDGMARLRDACKDIWTSLVCCLSSDTTIRQTCDDDREGADAQRAIATLASCILPTDASYAMQQNAWLDLNSVMAGMPPNQQRDFIYSILPLFIGRATAGYGWALEVVMLLADIYPGNLHGFIDRADMILNDTMSWEDVYTVLDMFSDMQPDQQEEFVGQAESLFAILSFRFVDEVSSQASLEVYHRDQSCVMYALFYVPYAKRARRVSRVEKHAQRRHDRTLSAANIIAILCTSKDVSFAADVTSASPPQPKQRRVHMLLG